MNIMNMRLMRLQEHKSEFNSPGSSKITRRLQKDNGSEEGLKSNVNTAWKQKGTPNLDSNIPCKDDMVAKRRTT
jgi:hypothetical protein